MKLNSRSSNCDVVSHIGNWLCGSGDKTVIDPKSPAPYCLRTLCRMRETSHPSGVPIPRACKSQWLITPVHFRFPTMLLDELVKFLAGHGPRTLHIQFPDGKTLDSSNEQSGRASARLPPWAGASHNPHFPPSFRFSVTGHFLCSVGICSIGRHNLAGHRRPYAYATEWVPQFEKTSSTSMRSKWLRSRREFRQIST